MSEAITEPRAACIAVNFESEAVRADFFVATEEHPDPGLMAEAFMQSVQDDFPNWHFTTWLNPAAVELRIARFGL